MSFTIHGLNDGHCAKYGEPHFAVLVRFPLYRKPAVEKHLGVRQWLAALANNSYRHLCTCRSNVGRTYID